MLMLVPIFLGAWQQAGNILRIKPFRPWLCETKHTWEGTPDEPEFLEALTQENGEVIHLRILKKHPVTQKSYALNQGCLRSWRIPWDVQLAFIHDMTLFGNAFQIVLHVCSEICWYVSLAGRLQDYMGPGMTSSPT